MRKTFHHFGISPYNISKFSSLQFLNNIIRQRHVTNPVCLSLKVFFLPCASYMKVHWPFSETPLEKIGLREFTTTYQMLLSTGILVSWVLESCTNRAEAAVRRKGWALIHSHNVEASGGESRYTFNLLTRDPRVLIRSFEFVLSSFSWSRDSWRRLSSCPRCKLKFTTLRFCKKCYRRLANKREI